MYRVVMVVKYLIWVFDTDCINCQNQISSLDSLVDQELRVIGVTDATSGRIQEFIMDFEPSFEIQPIDSSRLKRNKLMQGSTILIRYGKVRTIWRPDQMPTMMMEIISPLMLTILQRRIC